MKRSLIILLIILCLGASQAEASWTITQLTNNTTNDSHPVISGSNVVWQHWDGSDFEIYSNFAGQLTNNSYPDVILLFQEPMWYGPAVFHWVIMKFSVTLPGS